MDLCQKCQKKIDWDDQVCPHCGNRSAHDGDIFPKHTAFYIALAGIALVVVRWLFRLM